MNQTPLPPPFKREERLFLAIESDLIIMKGEKEERRERKKNKKTKKKRQRGKRGGKEAGGVGVGRGGGGAREEGRLRGGRSVLLSYQIISNHIFCGVFCFYFEEGGAGLTKKNK